MAADIEFSTTESPAAAWLKANANKFGWFKSRIEREAEKDRWHIEDVEGTMNLSANAQDATEQTPEAK